MSKTIIKGAEVKDSSLSHKSKTIKCSICGQRINIDESHNAQPINNGYCCNHCNSAYVIPARFAEMADRFNKNKESKGVA